MDTESPIVIITDGYLRLLRSLSSIQSVALRIDTPEPSPYDRANFGRVALNEVASAIEAAQKMHAMLATLELYLPLGILNQKGFGARPKL